MYTGMYIHTLEESPPFGIALVPDFANLGSILVLFWHPFATLGATLGTFGHDLGNLDDPWVKWLSFPPPKSSLGSNLGSLWEPVFHKSCIVSLKYGFPKHAHNQEQFLLDFCAISVTPGP